METIITLLIVLLPVAFKLIGKALENASDAPDIPQRRIQDDSEESARSHDEGRRGFERRPLTSEMSCSKEQVEDEPAVVSQPKKSEEDGKIDPKKLVLYSEIMKPKFDEKV
jgi:hypothetical protein